MWERGTYLSHTSSLSARSAHVCYRKSFGNLRALALGWTSPPVPARQRTPFFHTQRRNRDLEGGYALRDGVVFINTTREPAVD